MGLFAGVLLIVAVLGAPTLMANHMGAMAFLLAGLAISLLVLLVLGWKRVQLAGQLLGVAAKALRANPALLGFAAVLTLAKVMVIGPLGVLILLAARDGKVVASDPTTDPLGSFCNPTTGNCWVPSYRHVGAVVYVALVALWTLQLSMQLLVFVVAGVVAQWQDAEAASGTASGAERPAPAQSTSLAGAWHTSKPRVRDFVSHAMGPSLGSLALASLPLASSIIFLVQALARYRDEILQYGRPRALLVHIPARVLRGQCISLSGIAIVLASWTGEAYWVAAAASAALINWQRLVLIFFAVWFNTATITLLVYTLSSLYMFIMSLGLATGSAGEEPDSLDRRMVQPALMALCNLLSSLVLSLVSSLLLNIARAVVVLWIAEREEGQRGVYHRVGHASRAGAASSTQVGSEVDELCAPLMGLEPQADPGVELGESIPGQHVDRDIP
ncbi:hypothetical protein N2152v2_005919 [Parachlorella kessleri]